MGCLSSRSYDQLDTYGIARCENARITVNPGHGLAKRARQALQKVGVHFTSGEIRQLQARWADLALEGEVAAKDRLWVFLTSCDDIYGDNVTNLELTERIWSQLGEAEAVNFAVSMQVLTCLARGSVEEQLSYLFCACDVSGSWWIRSAQIYDLVVAFTDDGSAPGVVSKKAEKTVSQLLAVLDPNDEGRVGYELWIGSADFIAKSLGLVDGSALRPVERTDTRRGTRISSAPQGASLWRRSTAAHSDSPRSGSPDVAQRPSVVRNIGRKAAKTGRFLKRLGRASVGSNSPDAPVHRSPAQRAVAAASPPMQDFKFGDADAVSVGESSASPQHPGDGETDGPAGATVNRGSSLRRGVRKATSTYVACTAHAPPRPSVSRSNSLPAALEAGLVVPAQPSAPDADAVEKMKSIAAIMAGERPTFVPLVCDSPGAKRLSTDKTFAIDCLPIGPEDLGDAPPLVQPPGPLRWKSLRSFRRQGGMPSVQTVASINTAELSAMSRNGTPLMKPLMKTQLHRGVSTRTRSRRRMRGSPESPGAELARLELEASPGTQSLGTPPAAHIPPVSSPVMSARSGASFNIDHVTCNASPGPSPSRRPRASLPQPVKFAGLLRASQSPERGGNKLRTLLMKALAGESPSELERQGSSPTVASLPDPLGTGDATPVPGSPLNSTFRQVDCDWLPDVCVDAKDAVTTAFVAAALALAAGAALDPTAAPAAAKAWSPARGNTKRRKGKSPLKGDKPPVQAAKPRPAPESPGTQPLLHQIRAMTAGPMALLADRVDSVDTGFLRDDTEGSDALADSTGQHPAAVPHVAVTLSPLVRAPPPQSLGQALGMLDMAGLVTRVSSQGMSPHSFDTPLARAEKSPNFDSDSVHTGAGGTPTAPSPMDGALTPGSSRRHRLGSASPPPSQGHPDGSATTACCGTVTGNSPGASSEDSPEEKREAAAEAAEELISPPPRDVISPPMPALTAAPFPLPSAPPSPAGDDELPPLRFPSPRSRLASFVPSAPSDALQLSPHEGDERRGSVISRTSAARPVPKLCALLDAPPPALGDRVAALRAQEAAVPQEDESPLSIARSQSHVSLDFAATPDPAPLPASKTGTGQGSIPAPRPMLS